MFSIKPSVYFQKTTDNNKKLPNCAFNTNKKIFKILYKMFVVKDNIYVTI